MKIIKPSSKYSSLVLMYDATADDDGLPYLRLKFQFVVKLLLHSRLTIDV
jgi:hypothetical protein